ncbi:MAG: biotin/lipoyl-binding protein [Ardenticatenaceae bacterium]|nr:biotin/lipoyl-binding protein [Ardenticatenaceae bacterium]HBY98241.1 acetyl-CoA carboxylase biotin carboxyl carrier protein subunit [Chloroflexota bacterium]
MTTRYTTTVGDRLFEVVIHTDGRVEVDGQMLAVDLQHIADEQVWSLLVEQHSYEVYTEFVEGQWRVLVDGERHEVIVEDERLRLIKALGGKAARSVGDVQIKAPMPGLVVKVLVEEGESVAANQAVVILEAMKMENELRAARAGRIKGVRVQPGQAVDQGQVLLVLGDTVGEEV